MPFQRGFHLNLFGAVCILCSPLCAQFQQQGSRLFNTEVGNGTFYFALALSDDGNTALIGGDYDNNDSGAVWTFTRAGGVWSQKGDKLVRPNSSASYFGESIALSADGTTAIVGANGGVWGFTRTGGVWTLEGPLISDSGSFAGFPAVAISADGNTAIVGLSSAGLNNGGAWVFTRANGAWMQQGTRLAPSDVIGPVFLGAAVALSADGNTAIVGGPGDNNANGAGWVFTRSGGIWSQQGPKLPGSNPFSYRGEYVAISGDGNTAMIGGFYVGPLIFVRTNSAWTQQGPALAGIGGLGIDSQGGPVALSSDANTALFGVPESVGGGNAWVFNRVGNQWIQQGSKLIGSGDPVAKQQGRSIALSADGKTALVGSLVDAFAPGSVWPFAITAPKATPSFSASSSANMAAYNAQPTLTVHVIGNAGAGAIPTGTVSLLVDQVTQPGPVVTLAPSNPATFDAVATFNGLPAVPPGSHNVEFIYSGDAHYNAITGGALSQAINHGPTSVVINASTPIYPPDQLVLSFTVTGPWNVSIPGAWSGGVYVSSGTVTFTDSVKGVLGSVNLPESRQLALALSAFTPGKSYSITASYSGSGDADRTFDPSPPSQPLTFTFHQYSPLVTITSTANPVVYGNPVTLTAAVTPLSPGGPIPGGKVYLGGIFRQYPGIELPLDAAGKGSLRLPAGLSIDSLYQLVLGTGTNVISATYSGDANYVPIVTPSITMSLTQQVNKADTKIALTASPTGQSVTLAATVAPASLSPAPFPFACTAGNCSDGRPSGTLQFWSDSNLIGSAPLSPSSPTASTATLTTSFVPGSLRAVYSGDTNYNGSTSLCLLRRRLRPLPWPPNNCSQSDER